MRAYRLLSILLLLQTRGMVTARELADRLEVSPRTIYRDMDALSAAGVPVFAERGGNGGWRLLTGNTPDVPGLDAVQMRALQLGGRRDLLEDLGLREASELAWARLEAALGEQGNVNEPGFSQGRPQRHPQGQDERLLVDHPSWRGRRDVVTELPVIQRAVFSGQRLDMLYERNGEPVARTVDPLGLVIKGSVWYLVAQVGEQIRTYRISRVLEATLRRETFTRPPDFRLRSWWEASQVQFREVLPRFPLHVRVRGAPLEWLTRGGWWSVIEDQSPPDHDGFVEMNVTFDAYEWALAWCFIGGDDVQVIAPPELRADLVQRAQAVLRSADIETPPDAETPAAHPPHED